MEQSSSREREWLLRASALQPLNLKIEAKIKKRSGQRWTAGRTAEVYRLKETRRERAAFSPKLAFTPRAAQKFPPDIACNAPQESATTLPRQLPAESPREPLANGRTKCLRLPVQAAPVPAPQIDSTKIVSLREPEGRR